jgi:hypothetical protein
MPDGSVVVRLLVEADVPIVEPVKKCGILMMSVEVAPEIIAEAVRADRDEDR